MNDKEYVCSICKLKYKEKEWAEKCEEWCLENNSCNLEITRHSIEAGKTK